MNRETTDTTGDSRTITLEYINKSAEYMMKTVDIQLERIRNCESFGLWECAAYFISDRFKISVMAANTYKALVAGDRSSVENSFVNVWDATNSGTADVIAHLRHGLHPPEIRQRSNCLCHCGVRPLHFYCRSIPGTR